MTVVENIKQAEALCQRIRNASCTVGPQGRERTVRGVDPNELKKAYSFLLKHRDTTLLRKLVEKLPSSNFAQRSNLTQGYYKNMYSALTASGFFSIKDVENAIYILGYSCRLITGPFGVWSDRTDLPR